MEAIYSYSFLILLLPALSFVVLGLFGMKMSHKTAGLVGTTSLGIVTILSYLTAFSYFAADRTADGTFQTLVPYRHGYPARSHFGDDAHCYLDGQFHGAYLLIRLHAW